MGSLYEFLFGPEPEPDPPKKPDAVTHTACANCAADISVPHCKVCDWFLCGRCGEWTEASTGRTFIK